MPRNYKRKTDRQSWSTEAMQKAIEAVHKNEMGWLLASKTFGVPQATLRRHVLGNNKILGANSKGLGSWKVTFPPDVEKQLVQHLKFLEGRLFGLTRSSVQELAYQLAEKNGFSHRFNRQKQKAGQDWMDGFLRRNKDISLRKPEATSAARAQAFNRPQVQKFFQLYGKLLESVEFKPHRIYNADESGLSTVQKPQKILATTGRKQVGVLTSAERGTNTTVVCCANAIGTFVPPMMIFPRKNMKQELIDGAPPSTLGVPQQSGWMTTDIFFKWIKHFQSFVKASVNDKIILIVDGHASHKGIETLEYAKENGIHVICLPPHCTHRMQPLDVSFFAPLKTFFNQEISKWLKAHPGRVVTQFQISSLFNVAYGKAATVQNACHGFKSTGIWPLNPEVFPDYMYEPAETTNIPLEVVNSELPHQQMSPIPGPSRQQDDEPCLASVTDVQAVANTVDNEADSSSYVLSVPIEEISPTPKGRFISGQGKRKPKARQTSLVLTSTPNMTDIKSKNNPKDTSPKRKRAATRNLNNDDSDYAQDDEEDCPCIYCNDLYSRSKPRENWLRCMSCSHWAHASCADVPSRIKRFICELCQS